MSLKIKNEIIDPYSLIPEERIIPVCKTKNFYPEIFQILIWGSIDKIKSDNGDYYPTRFALICNN